MKRQQFRLTALAIALLGLLACDTSGGDATGSADADASSGLEDGASTGDIQAVTDTGGAPDGQDVAQTMDTADSLDTADATTPPGGEADATPPGTPKGPPEVTFVTSLGSFTIQLYPDAAPLTVANFLNYVESGFFDGSDGLGATQFHRVIYEFMVQGGGYTAQGQLKTSQPPVVHEGPNNQSNVRGTVAMARTDDPDSATSQFFVNHVDNLFLDYTSPSVPGYVVFGHVIEGMDTIDAIASVPTSASDQPFTTVMIESATNVTM
jgi:peptidyl-prolyl cis-trans isomerase A (cyclophilin A)